MPPHFHATYGDDEAQVEIASGDIVGGSLSPPLQLRHAAGTEARSAGGGLDAAQVRLGHKNANITQVYAEVSREKAAA